MLILKEEIIEKIKDDQVLFGKVSKAMGLSIRTMFDLLPKPIARERLTTATVLRVLRDHLKIKKDSELLMEEPIAA